MKKKGIIVVDGAEGLTNADAKQYHRALAKNTKHTIAVSAVDSDDEQGDAELKKFPPDGVKYGLSFASMDEAISMQQPRQRIKDGDVDKWTKHNLCCGPGSSTGWLCPCSSEYRHSDLQVYGSGIVLYFQLLKFMFFVFIVMVVINLPALTIYGSAGQGFKPSSNPNAFLPQLSLGHLGQEENVCETVAFVIPDDDTDGAPIANVYLTC